MLYSNENATLLCLMLMKENLIILKAEKCRWEGATSDLEVDFLKTYVLVYA